VNAEKMSGRRVEQDGRGSPARSTIGFIELMWLVPGSEYLCCTVVETFNV
jgi:hypothetical protein